VAPARAYASAVAYGHEPPWDRTGDLERIRNAYARYDELDRSRLWDPSNRGYRRLSADLRRRLVSEIRGALPASAGRVLDLGCGTGDLLADVEREGLRPDWHGIDLRPEAIEVARARFPGSSFEVASADATGHADGRFHVIVAQVLFSSLPSPSLELAVAGEIGRLLAPGGWLVWSDLRVSNPANPSVHGINMRWLRSLFEGWELRVTSAGLVPPVARRLGRTTPVLYPLLSRLPPLHSHLVGRLRPPGDRDG